MIGGEELAVTESARPLSQPRVTPRGSGPSGHVTGRNHRFETQPLPIVCAPTRKRPSISGSIHPGICSGTDVAGAAAPETEEAVVSRFTEKMYRNARTVTDGHGHR